MSPRFSVSVLVVASIFGLTQSLQADEIKKLVLPGEAFQVEGRPAFILWPEESLRKTPQPWVFYAPTLAGYPDEHEKWMHQQFLSAGVAVAGIDVGEGYGSPAARKLFDAFYDQMAAQRGLARSGEEALSIGTKSRRLVGDLVGVRSSGTICRVGRHLSRV